MLGSGFSRFILICSSIWIQLALGSLLQDYDKCLLWLKTDGSSCQPSTYFSLQKWALGFAPTISLRKTCCDDGTGCFTINKDTPWECYNELPECMDSVKPKFYFYTRERSRNVQMVDYARLNASVKVLDAGPSTPTEPRPFFAIVHGFGAAWPKDWMFNLKDRLVALGNNVLIVRWTEGARDPWYFKAAANTRTVGAALAMVMKSMQSAGKLSLNSSTIVGFSLGGHIAGYAGSNLPKLKRIIALDPAGPMFQCMNPKARLDSTDALFVQAIHTHGDYFLMGGCGTLQQYGDMDVYVNGGVRQAGCNRGVPQAFQDFLKLNFSAMSEDVSCSHNRMPKLFIEMVANAGDPAQAGGPPCQYRGFPCTSGEEFLAGLCFECPADRGCPTVGYATDLKDGRSGKFYLNTLGDNSTTGQYCGRQLLLSLTGDHTLKGRITVVIKGSGNVYTQPILFQDMYDVMIGGEEKKIVAVVPWSMTEIEEVEIEYTRNKLILTGGPSSWNLNSVYLQDIDGKKFENNQQNLVIDGRTTTVSFSSHDMDPIPETTVEPEIGSTFESEAETIEPTSDPDVATDPDEKSSISDVISTTTRGSWFSG